MRPHPERYGFLYPTLWASTRAWGAPFRSEGAFLLEKADGIIRPKPPDYQVESADVATEDAPERPEQYLPQTKRIS
jgi:hypothetical protein